MTTKLLLSSSARCLLAALAALALSGVVVIGIYITLFEHFHPEFAGVIEQPKPPVTLHGNAFVPVVFGNGRYEGNTSVISALHQGRAILETPVTFRPQDYALLRITAEGLHPGLKLMLIWRTKQHPGRDLRFDLHSGRDGENLFNLRALLPEEGTIATLAIGVRGELRDAPFRLESVSFEPYGSSNLLRTVWQEWCSFRGWSHRSINVLRGVPPYSIVHPTPLVAAWAGIAGALLYLLPASLVGWRAAAVVTVIGLCWLFLDYLWRSELATQLDETRRNFAGKTLHEKQTADIDGALYTYAQDLKNLLADEPDARLFILKERTGYGHDFTRLKLHYFLLPRRIYNYGAAPPTNSVVPGDYLLLLGMLPEKEFDHASSVLRLGDVQLSATLQDSNEFGDLYRICANAKTASATELSRGFLCPQ